MKAIRVPLIWLLPLPGCGGGRQSRLAKAKETGKLFRELRVFHTLLNWFYRIAAPGHPRGWLQFHAVADEGDPPRRWVHCHGMERWNLPNLEIVEVPDDLIGYAHAIIFEVVGYMKGEKPIKADETFGGAWVGGAEQPVFHVATIRRAPARDGHSGLLRIVDEGEPVESGFPRRLFAAHMSALAFQMRDPRRQEDVFRRIVAFWPGQPAAAGETGFEFGQNPNNYIAWLGLGDALCDQGRFDEGLAALRDAVARSPGWAADFVAHLRETTLPDALEDPAADPRFRFWREFGGGEG